MFVKLKTMSVKKYINKYKYIKLSSIILLELIFILTIILKPINGLNNDTNNEINFQQRAARKLFGGYRITPKFCRPSRTLPKTDPRSNGPTICMFNHECAQRNGEVVGACMDGFLFGACCQIPGVVDTTLIQTTHKFTKPTSSSNLAAAYESYGSQQNSNEFHQITDEGIYDTASELDVDSSERPQQMTNYLVQNDLQPNKFYVNKGSVLISSPSSSNKVDSYQPVKVTSDGKPYLPPPLSSSTNSPPPKFSTELPMKITYQNELTIIQTTVNPQKLPESTDIFGSSEFTHSDITHPGAESVLLEDDQQFSSGYGPSTVYVPPPTKETVIQSGTIIHKKPVFKPKPFISTTLRPPIEDKYVLVQTITNGNAQVNIKHPSTVAPSLKPVTGSGMTTNNMASIESIILMLNSTNHGPAYNVVNSTTQRIETSKSPLLASYDSSSRPDVAGQNIPNEIHNYGEISTPPSVIVTGTNILSESTPSTTKGTAISSQNTNSYHSTTMKPIENTPTISNTQFYISSSSRPIIITSSGTKRPTVQAYKKRPSLKPLNEDSVVIPPRKPISKRPPSTSYVTGPTPPRNPPTYSYFEGSSTLPTNDASYVTSSVSPSADPAIYSSQYAVSTQKITIDKNDENNDRYKPIFVKYPALSTLRPHPTVIITPKPTVNSANEQKHTTTPIPKLPSTSYIFSPIVTKRPEGLLSSTSDYVGLPSISSNDFDDPGYYAHSSALPLANIYQVTPENLYPPQSNMPAYAGYYGPTPSYSTFNVPTAESDKLEEEETYTSPNDFVNFPPVRNPNLNMSATSSAVTNDFEMSTPAFIEDDVLKSKMNVLVEKIVASLQGNFQDLADLVDEDNGTFVVQGQTKRPSTSNLEPKPTTRITTKRPVTRVPVRATTTKLNTKKPINKRPSGTTKRPTPTTKKPNVNKKPTTLIKRPVTTTKKPAKPTKQSTKPTKRTPTTTTEPIEEEETVEEQVNDEENEIETESGEDGRRFQCGIRPHVKSGRIVGGKGATFGEWPWQVLVRESTWLGLFTKNKCGGVLITNKFVVTAAHCQPGFLASLVAVFGEFDISGDLETKRSVTKNVKRVIVHRQYDAATFENDLALLELESAIHYDTHIIPICMPPDSSDFTGRMATVTGWGRLKYGGGVPSVLQEVQVPIIENSVCQEMFHTSGHNKKILPSFLCAGYANGQKDSCEGDSGGPLVMQRQDGRWELVGTVSHGIKCAAPFLPGVYMRTTFYKPWLRSITGLK